MRGLLLVAALGLAARPARADEAAARTACELNEPTCDPSLLLSGLERTAIDRVLAEDPTLAIEHAPSGKRIAAVRVVRQDVFVPGDLLRFMSALHWTTQDHIVRRELSLEPGDAWDQRKVDESARRLRDPQLVSVVAIIPLVAPDDQVEMLVVTRDVWSLRADTTWELQDGKITFLSVAFAEYNLMGRRRQIALSLVMDQGSAFLGPRYVERNIAGKHVDLLIRGGPVLRRGSNEVEGSESEVSIARPLWSLDTKWGANLHWLHRDAVERSFVGDTTKGYVCGSGSCRDATGDDDPADVVPHVFRLRELSLVASAVRAFGDERLQERVSGGYELLARRSRLPETFPNDPVQQAAFRDEILPPSERTSAVFVGGELYEPRFRRVQNLDSFELAEDVPMGATATAKLGLALEWLGSTSSFLRPSAGAGYTAAVGDDGIISVRADGAVRLGGGPASDGAVDATVRFATPSFLFGRLVTQVQAGAVFRDTQNTFLTVGGSNGLRGFPINAFDGDRRAVWNTELRTKPISLGYTRWGLVAFYDVGGAAASFRSMRLHHDAGVGVRVLLPQLQSGVFRVDLGTTLDGPGRGELRITAGRAQVF